MRDDQVQILPYSHNVGGHHDGPAPDTDGHVAVGIVHLRRHAGGQTTTCRSIQVKTPTRGADLKAAVEGRQQAAPGAREDGGSRMPRAGTRVFRAGPELEPDQGLVHRHDAGHVGAVDAAWPQVRAIDRRVPVDGPEYPPDALARQW